MEKNKVIILIPSLNEIKSLKRICYSLKKNRLNFIVLDDCSTDGTEKWLKTNNINYLRNKKILGYENNIKKGIYHVSKNKNFKFLITFDGDGEHKVHYIYKIIKNKTFNNFDLLICNRKKLNRWSEYLLSFFSNKIIGVKDPLTGFKVYKISELIKYKNRINPNFFLVDIVINFYKRRKIIRNYHIKTYKKKYSRIGHGFIVHLKIIKILFRLIFR